MTHPPFANLNRRGGALMTLRHHGEECFYRPGGEGNRDVKAIVMRDPDEFLLGLSEARTVSAVVRVLDDDTDGVSAVEVDRGKDKFRYPDRLGGTEYVERYVHEILEQDGGTIVLGLL